MSKAYYVSRVGRVAMGNDIKFLVKKKKIQRGGMGRDRINIKMKEE